MRKLNSGFSLVEMAVVIVIIGLTLGAVLGIASTQLLSAKISSTKQKQEAIKTALSNFVARYDRLPCPAIATISNTPLNAAYGVEAATPGTCAGTIVNGNVATGVVPWVTLGLTEEISTDGYYNRFTYQVTREATATNAKTVSSVRGAITTHYNAPVQIGAPDTGNQSNDCKPAELNFNPCAALAVVISHGANGFGAYTRDGNQLGLPPGADEMANVNADSAFVIKDFLTDTDNPFDDVVMVLSPNDLIASLAARGALKDYKIIVQQDFESIQSAVITKTISDRTGENGTYQYTLPLLLPALPIDKLNDPWGRAYIYAVNLTTPFNANTLSSIDAFTIKSLGPDGVESADDLVDIVYVNDLQHVISKTGW